MNLKIVSAILNIRIRLIQRFYFPFIFNSTDAMRAFGYMEDNFLFVGSSANKIQYGFAARTLNDVRCDRFCAAIRTDVTKLARRLYRVHQKYCVTFRIVTFSEVPLYSISIFDNSLHKIFDSCNVKSSD